jgi:hypothetical protein
MAVISLVAVRKELLLACRQLGCVVSETLAALITATIFSVNSGGFYVENPLNEADARIVVEEAAKKLLSKDEPGISCLRLQAAYEGAFAEIEQKAQKERLEASNAEQKALKTISGFSAKFTEDFETLTGLYKKIYQLLLLRCTKPWGVATHQKDEGVEREVAAALESVFPRVGLRSFVALTGPEKTAQLQELSGIVLGIRLFNQHQGKGGTGLPKLDETVTKLGVEDLLQNVQKEVEQVTELCKVHTDVALASKKPGRGSSDKPLPEPEMDKLLSNLLYHRQYLNYLLNLQEDLSASIERLRADQSNLQEELLDLDALVGGRVSVPKEQVYPRFDGLARTYATAFQEVKSLEARSKLHVVLQDLRRQYFPALSLPAQRILERVRETGGADAGAAEDGEEPVDLDAIPGPEAGEEGAVRLTADNADNFMTLPLDFQGFCVHTLVSTGGLLQPGNPALGVVRYAGRFCVFATESALAEFCTEPDRFFGGVREVCYKNPELIHLLRVHEDFPRSSLVAIVQQQSAVGQAPLQADVSTETPLHFQESNIDKSYEWNEWALRKEALHMADIRKKSTSATQTALSHLRRENETQVYLPKDQTTNTVVNSGTNPPRWKKYHTGMRGEPQPMKVVDVRFDLK